MARENTYAGKLGDWRRLLSPLEANAAELGHLEVQRAKLEELWTRMLEISTQQAARTAEKQEASQQLRSLAVEGDRVANVLRMSIKVHFGIRAEKLAEFGMRAFRGRPRKAKGAPEGTDPAGPAQPTPVTPEPTNDRRNS